jgi:hypothetical protein
MIENPEMTKNLMDADVENPQMISLVNQIGDQEIGKTQNPGIL